MKISRKEIRFIWIGLLTMAHLPDICGQSPGLSYQLILETKGEYNNLDPDSKINPGNKMGIPDFTSLSQLYPILRFNAESENVNTELGVEMNFKNYDFEKDSTDFLFQELYTQFSIRHKSYIVLGKKRLDWGTGRIWNPTNFFVQKDPLRTQNRLEGIFMLNYSRLFGQNMLSFYVFPDKKINDFKAAVKFDYSGNRIDGSLSFVQYGKYQQFGGDVSYGGDLFTLYAEGIIRNFSKNYRIDRDGKLLAPDEIKKRFRPELIGGGSIVFNSNLSFMGEYRFRGDYLNKAEVNLFEHYLPDNTILWDPISISRHTVFGSLTYADTYGRWSINLRSFYDPVSGQLIVSPLGVLSMNNFQVEVSTLFYNNEFSIHNFQSSVLVSCFF